MYLQPGEAKWILFSSKTFHLSSIQNSIKNSIILWPVLLIVTVILNGCASSQITVASNEPAFSLSEAQLQGFVGAQFPLEIEKLESNQSKQYTLSYQFAKTSEAQHWIVSILIKKGDELLTSEIYLSSKEAAQNSLNDSELDRSYPKIGKFAIWEPIGFGPGGVAEQLTFKTSDKLWDVKIVISHLMPNGVDEPNISIEHIAKEINHIYQTKHGARYE